MIEIVSRWDKDKVLYRAETAQDIRAAVIEAREKGASLRGADLGSANLGEADLRGADLWAANLGGANLAGADLRGANLAGANLGGASLRGANLGGASLWGADLWRANLGGAEGAPLVVEGLPSGSALIHLSHGEWRIRVGCWTGTPDELETLIAGDEWPEAKGDEQEKRRPALTALVALARAHSGYAEATAPADDAESGEVSSDV